MRRRTEFTVIASAIVIAGLLIAASLFVAVGGAKTITVTKTVTTTSLSTLTTMTTATLSATNSESITSESTQTSLDTNFTTNFYYQVSVNYSGSWNLAYWGQNGTLTQNNAVYCNECYGGVMQYNVYGNLTGSGNYQTEITTYGVGYVENVLCIDAAILNANTGTLTLTVLGKTGIATALINPSVEVCVTYAV
jgi:hypothetical protein